MDYEVPMQAQGQDKAGEDEHDNRGRADSGILMEMKRGSFASRKRNKLASRDISRRYVHCS